MVRRTNDTQHQPTTNIQHTPNIEQLQERQTTSPINNQQPKHRQRQETTNNTQRITNNKQHATYNKQQTIHETDKRQQSNINGKQNTPMNNKQHNNNKH